ncbi:hypothetical protein CsatB_023460 [Cannabis sativa]
MDVINSNTRYYLRITLGMFSAIVGLIFLSQSSFFKIQFNNNTSSRLFVFASLSALLIFLVFVAPSWSELLQKVWNLNFSLKCLIDSFFLGVVWLLAFLIKYPRFDVHSKYRKSCVEEQGKKMLHGSQYTLFSIGGFALLALLLSSDSHKTIELGLFSVLIGLIMDTSMEIPAYDDGPNLRYMFGAVLYCIGLIFLRRYIESLLGSRDSDDYIISPVNLKGHKRGKLRNIFRNLLELFSAIVGLICLFLSPFFEQQFEDAENLKGVCFITFSLLLGYSLLKAPHLINRVVKKCHGKYLVQTMVKSFFFMIVSVVIFMNKYPRFRIHSTYIESCGVKKGERIFQGNQFDVFTTGSFSLFALAISSQREQPVKLGMFSFLLELTMDTSIEILGNDGPNFLYMLGAFVYCVLLILIKSYLDSLMMEYNGSSVEKQQSYQDQVEDSTVLNPRGKAFEDEQEKPLIEIFTGKQNEHEIIDNELGLAKTDNTDVGEASGHVARQYRNTGDETYGSVSSHIEDLSGFSHKDRLRALRREKAKRERARKRESRIEKEDLWIS